MQYFHWFSQQKINKQVPILFDFLMGRSIFQHGCRAESGLHQITIAWCRSLTAHALQVIMETGTFERCHTRCCSGIFPWCRTFRSLEMVYLKRFSSINPRLQTIFSHFYIQQYLYCKSNLSTIAVIQTNSKKYSFLILILDMVRAIYGQILSSSALSH